MSTEIKQRPSAGIAAVLSFLIPGLGQLYQGKFLVALVWLVCTGIGYFLLIVPGLVLHLSCIACALSTSDKSEP